MVYLAYSGSFSSSRPHDTEYQLPEINSDDIERNTREQTRERTRQALHRLDGIKPCDRRRVKSKDRISLTHHHQDIHALSTSLSRSIYEPPLTVPQSLRQSQSSGALRGRRLQASYGIFPSSPSKNVPNNRNMVEYHAPRPRTPPPPLRKPPPPPVPSTRRSKSISRSIHKPLRASEAFPLLSQRPKTSTGAEKAPPPIGHAFQPLGQRKLSLSEAQTWQDRKSSNAVSKTQTASSFRPLTPEKDREIKIKKEKSASWELPQLFKRRKTPLEKGKHRSTPALRARARTWGSRQQEDIPPLPVHTSFTTTSLLAQTMLSPCLDEDPFLDSPLRSEFSEDSDSEAEFEWDSGKMGKLVKRMKRRFHMKR